VKSTAFQFTVPIYGAHVRVEVTDDFNSALSRFDPTICPDGQDAQGMVSWDDCKRFLVLIKPKHRHDARVICHELYHLTNRILHHFGVAADFENDEAGAYLQDFLAGKILPRLLR
jgi:hypothetical protein